MHLHCLAESIAASAVVQALLAVGRCRDVLPVECMSAEFWQSVSQLNYERHRERGRPAGSRTNNDGDGQLLAAAAPIPLPGYRKVRVKIGDPAAPTEVCTYLAGDFDIPALATGTNWALVHLWQLFSACQFINTSSHVR